jgi:flagellar motor switch protein FliM
VSAPQTPADLRAYIVERLVGDTGEPCALLDAARSLAERAAPKIAAALNAQFAAPLPPISVEEVALSRFADAARHDEPLAAFLVVASPSSPDALALGLDALALGAAVGAMFGADPDLAPAPVGAEPSAIERDVAAVVFGECVAAVNGFGPRAFGLDGPAPSPLTGAALARVALRDGPAVRIRFRLGAEAGPPGGAILLSMPQRVLLKHRGPPEEPVAPGAAAFARPKPDWSAHLGDEVMRANVTLSAAMPLGRLSLGEIAALQPGQVLAVEAQATAQVRLSARGKTLFSGEFGRLGPRYTVRVGEPFDAARDLLDSLAPPG